MKFVEVKEVPEYKRQRRGIMRERMDEFMKMNLKAVKVENHDYKSASSAYKAFHTAAKRWVLPIDVVTRKGEIYLVRRDM